MGFDAIALQMVSVGIHLEGHRGDAVVVEELVVGKSELLPGDGIVGIGRFLVESVIGQFCSLMLRNNEPVHRHDGVEQGRVNGGLEFPVEQHIHEDITVVIGLLGGGEQLQQLLTICDGRLPHRHAFFLIGYEFLIVADIDKQNTVGHMAHLHTQELLEVGNLLLGGILSGHGMDGVGHHITEDGDGQTDQEGDAQRLLVVTKPTRKTLPEGFHHFLFKSKTLAVALFMRFMVLPTPAP